MALIEVCFFLVFFLSLGLLFPFMQLFIIILSPHSFEWVAIEKPIKHTNCDTARDYEENSFADAILWADVGNDL